MSEEIKGGVRFGIAISSRTIGFLAFLYLFLGVASLGWHAQTAYRDICSYYNMQFLLEMKKLDASMRNRIYFRPNMKEAPNLEPSINEISVDKPDCPPKG